MRISLVVVLLWSFGHSRGCDFDAIAFEPLFLENIRKDTNSTVLVTMKKTGGSPSGSITAFCGESYPLNCEATVIAVEDLDIKEGGSTRTVNISIEGKFIGITKLFLECDGGPLNHSDYTVRIIRSDHEEYMVGIFNSCAAVFIIFINFLLGTQLEVEKIKNIIKFPIGPITSICVQFLLMPLFGFALAKLVIPDDQKAMQLSLFAAACSPGGGKSSFWTIIFDGNLDLSVTMTFSQTVIAIGMMPLWLKFLLGPYFFTERVQIPIEHLCLALGGLIGPVSLGMIAISYKKHLVERLNFVIKAVTWFATLFFTAFAIYVNWYAFFLFKPHVIFCACALPWTGYLLAYSVAYFAQQGARERITIAIETGVQNLAISAILIITAFPDPERDLALVMTFAIVLVTDKPLMLIYAIGWLRRRCSKRRGTVASSASQIPITSIIGQKEEQLKYIDESVQGSSQSLDDKAKA